MSKDKVKIPKSCRICDVRFKWYKCGRNYASIQCYIVRQQQRDKEGKKGMEPEEKFCGNCAFVDANGKDNKCPYFWPCMMKAKNLPYWEPQKEKEKDG